MGIPNIVSIVLPSSNVYFLCKYIPTQIVMCLILTSPSSPFSNTSLCFCMRIGRSFIIVCYNIILSYYCVVILLQYSIIISMYSINNESFYHLSMFGRCLVDVRLTVCRLLAVGCFCLLLTWANIEPLLAISEVSLIVLKRWTNSWISTQGSLNIF